MGNKVGMDESMGRTEIDGRGRITIPKEIREKVGLRPGDRVRVTAEHDRAIVQRTVDTTTFVKELRGCITVEGEIDPPDLKRIWREVR